LPAWIFVPLRAGVGKVAAGCLTCCPYCPCLHPMERINHSLLPANALGPRGVRARILYMRLKNFVKAARGTHPPNQVSHSHDLRGKFWLTTLGFLIFP